MKRRTLHQDLLHSGKYHQRIVKAKKGKGAFSRHDKHKKHRQDFSGGVFLWAVCGGVTAKTALPGREIS